MGYKIIKNNFFHLKEFRKYLNFYLRGTLDYNLNSINSNQVSSNTTLHYYDNGGVDSIFYFKKDGYFYFGLDNDIDFFSNIKNVKSPTTNIKYRIKLKNSFNFAENEKGDIFLIVPIFFESLSDREIFILFEKNDIISISNKNYINFGSLSGGINILRNLRNFMFGSKVYMNVTDYLKIKCVYIPKYFFSDERFCRKCGNLIDKSFHNKKFLNEYKNSDRICADCYSKILMGYYSSKISSDIYKKKNILEKLSNTNKLFGFYFNLFNYYGMFDGEGNLCTEHLKDYYHSEIIPNELLLNSPEYFQSIRILNNINKIISFGESETFSSFEKVLYKNGLSYKDGLCIKEELENDVLFGSLNYDFHISNAEIIDDIKFKIDEYIEKMKKNENNSINIFNSIMGLNKLTLNSNGYFNKQFLNRIVGEGLDKRKCVEIRKKLILEINKGNIDEKNINAYFNRLINLNIGEHKGK